MKKSQFPYAFKTEDLWENLNPKLLKHPWVVNRYNNRKTLATRMFDEFFYIILDDMIENNVTFAAPTIKGDYVDISINAIDGEKFKDIYNRGGFAKVDYIKSNFTKNMVVYNYNDADKNMRQKRIYIDGDLEKKLIEYTEQGKQYY